MGARFLFLSCSPVRRSPNSVVPTCHAFSSCEMAEAPLDESSSVRAAVPMSESNDEGKSVSRIDEDLKFPGARELIVPNPSASIMAESGSITNSSFAGAGSPKAEMAVTFAVIAMLDDSSAKPGEGIGLAQPTAIGEEGCSENPAFTCGLSAVWEVRVTSRGLQCSETHPRFHRKGFYRPKSATRR